MFEKYSRFTTFFVGGLTSIFKRKKIKLYKKTPCIVYKAKRDSTPKMHILAF